MGNIPGGGMSRSASLAWSPVCHISFKSHRLAFSHFSTELRRGYQSHAHDVGCESELLTRGGFPDCFLANGQHGANPDFQSLDFCWTWGEDGTTGWEWLHWKLVIAGLIVSHGWIFLCFPLRNALWQTGSDHDLLCETWNGYQIWPKDQQGWFGRPGFSQVSHLLKLLSQYKNLHQKQSQPSGSNVFPAQVSYVPLGIDTNEFRIAALDTGTVRHGLEKTTYAVRVKDTVVIWKRYLSEIHDTAP